MAAPPGIGSEAAGWGWGEQGVRGVWGGVGGASGWQNDIIGVQSTN